LSWARRVQALAAGLDHVARALGTDDAALFFEDEHARS
jgi:hypothetical protein